MSVDSISMATSKSHKNWEKARERFADTCQPEIQASKAQKNKSWIRAEETETTETDTHS